MLCVYLLINIQVCVYFSVAIRAWQRGLNYWMSVAVWTLHHLVAVVVCSISMTFGIWADLSGQFMHIQNKKHQASDGWDLWSKWRRRPALGMTTVQVHQLMLTLQRESCQSQIAVLFIQLWFQKKNVSNIMLSFFVLVMCYSYKSWVRIKKQELVMCAHHHFPN